MKRCFIALPLAEVFRNECVQIQKKFRIYHSHLKWVLPQQFHVTLHFFGALDDQGQQKARHLIKMPGLFTKPLVLGLGGLGVFPDWRVPSVLWIDLRGELKKLAELQEEIVLRVRQAGLPVEKKPFKAHATLARFRAQGRQDPKPPLDEMRKMAGGSGSQTDMREVQSIVLYESKLTPAGPQYEAIERVCA